MSSCPLILVRWLDSRQPCSAWRYLADVGEPKAVECATVGWLLKDNDDVKVVCQSVGDLGDPAKAQASGVMTIPARCVVSMDRLEEVDIGEAWSRKPYAPDWREVSRTSNRSTQIVERKGP